MSRSVLARLLRRQIADPGAVWSMGTFGAFATYRHDAGDAADTGPLRHVTARGGIALSLPADLTAVACETLSHRPGHWGQALMLCLPAASAAMNRRAMLTELGPDREALRKGDRGAVLFDMGLDLPQVDFCIRTADPALIATLRAALGKPLMASGNSALAAVLAAHPHRVALTRLGRVEVCQKIGGRDTDGVSPPGPRTHVLPQVLRSGRTHSANHPIPSGLVPCAGLYPANPLTDGEGGDRPHDAGAARGWAWIYDRFGRGDLVTLKADLARHIGAGVAPGMLVLPEGRDERRALRVAIRQAAAAPGADAVLLARWRAAHDGGVEVGEDSPELVGQR